MAARPFILFDLGGVLVENVGFERLARLLPAPIGIEALKERWLASTIVRRFELGQCDAKQFACTLVAEWELACSPEAFLDEFAAWPKGFYAGATDLLQSLRERHRIGCLTNSNALHWARFGGFAGLFDVALSSHLIGAIKPDLACFELAIAACDRRPGEILYVDDARLNVDAARSAGLDAVWTDGFASLLRFLLDRRVIDRQEASLPASG